MKMMAAAATTPKKCVLVTGPPGVGKTTLIMKVLDNLRNAHPHLKIQGFYTREVRHGCERTGFEVVTVDGRTSVLASSTPMSESVRWPNVGKYKVDVSGFESLALPELQIKEDTGLFIIDEVGKMELFSASFFPAVKSVLDSNIPVLASIPIPKFGRDIPEVACIRNRRDVALHTLNKASWAAGSLWMLPGVVKEGLPRVVKEWLPRVVEEWLPRVSRSSLSALGAAPP